MTFSVVIQRVSDQKIVVVDGGEWDAEDDHSEWYWTEGNMGCDCNLSAQFAIGEGEARPDDRPCGNSAYRVIEFRLSNGAVVACQPQL